MVGATYYCWQVGSYIRTAAGKVWVTTVGKVGVTNYCRHGGSVAATYQWWHSGSHPFHSFTGVQDSILIILYGFLLWWVPFINTAIWWELLSLDIFSSQYTDRHYRNEICISLCMVNSYKYTFLCGVKDKCTWIIGLCIVYWYISVVDTLDRCYISYQSLSVSWYVSCI